MFIQSDGSVTQDYNKNLMCACNFFTEKRLLVAFKVQRQYSAFSERTLRPLVTHI